MIFLKKNASFRFKNADEIFLLRKTSMGINGAGAIDAFCIELGLVPAKERKYLGIALTVIDRYVFYEFLGDAVLNFIVEDIRRIHREYPSMIDVKNKTLETLKSNRVLQGIAESNGIKRWGHASNGVALYKLMEGILGATFIDSGYEAAYRNFLALAKKSYSYLGTFEKLSVPYPHDRFAIWDLNNERNVNALTKFLISVFLRHFEQYPVIEITRNKKDFTEMPGLRLRYREKLSKRYLADIENKILLKKDKLKVAKYIRKHGVDKAWSKLQKKAATPVFKLLSKKPWKKRISAQKEQRLIQNIRLAILKAFGIPD